MVFFIFCYIGVIGFKGVGVGFDQGERKGKNCKNERVRRLIYEIRCFSL